MNLDLTEDLFIKLMIILGKTLLFNPNKKDLRNQSISLKSLTIMNKYITKYKFKTLFC